jgi:large subunit ribosomal protein L15
MTNLPKIVDSRPKRLGRGYGSGKGGHTSGRGQKGQKARRSMGVLFEGYKVRKSLYKRLPFLRGKGKFKAHNKPAYVNVEDLNSLPAGSDVTIELLAQHHLIEVNYANIYGVKILGNGKLDKKLKVALPTTESAAEKIKQAGGEVVSE